MCAQMRASPCGNYWRRWERCVKSAKDEEGKDFVTECMKQTQGLSMCMEYEKDYFEQFRSPPDAAKSLEPKQESQVKGWMKLTSVYDVQGIVTTEGCGPDVTYVKAPETSPDWSGFTGSISEGIVDFNALYKEGEGVNLTSKGEDGEDVTTFMQDGGIEAVWIRASHDDDQGLFLGAAVGTDLKKHEGKVLFSVLDDAKSVDIYWKVKGENGVVKERKNVVRKWD